MDQQLHLDLEYDLLHRWREQQQKIGGAPIPEPLYVALSGRYREGSSASEVT